METSVTVERLNNEEAADFLPSQEILRENLKENRKKRPTKKSLIFKKYKCRICYEEFDDKSVLNIHQNTHDPDNPFACTKCTYKTNNRKYLSRHTRKVHNKDKYKQECDVCGKKFLFKCLLEKHIRVHTGEKPNKCDVCGKAFNSSYSLNTHRFIHTNEKPYKCSFCDHACRDSSSLRKHQSIHLGIAKKYPCEECSNKYDTKIRLIEHVNQIHRGIEPEKKTCNICGTNFKNKWTLANHVKAVHDKSTSCVCGICGRRLTNSANLHSHMRSHLELRPFKCTYPGCTRKYKDRGTLKKHARIHYPEQQVICNDCGKSFTRKARLVAHFAQHLPKVKNTECPFCGVCFYNKNYLLKHLRTVHGKRNKFICDICSFESNNKPGLVVHIRHAHKNLDKQCHVCKKTYKRKCNLTLHYRNTHNISFKTSIDKPMVVIKQEPLDFSPDLEIDLLDIDKEEPFAGFDVDPDYEYDMTMPTTLVEAMNSSEEVVGNHTEESRGEEEKHLDQEKTEDVSMDGEQPATANVYEETEGTTENLTATELRETESTPQVQPEGRAMQVDEFLQRVMSNNDITAKDKPEDISTDNNSGKESTQTEPVLRTMQADEFLQHVMSDTYIHAGDKTEIPPADTKSKGENTQAEPGRRTMQVDEFLQHVMDTEIQTDKTETPSADTNSNGESTQAEPGRRTMQVDEFLQHVMSDTEIQTDTTETPAISDSKEESTPAEPGRRTMQVDEFLQHVMSDTEIQTDDIEEESEEHVRIRIKELIEKSNLKNGIRKKKTAYGRKLERVHVDEISKFLFKNINIEVNGEVITQIGEKKERCVKKKKRKKSKRSQEEKMEKKKKKLLSNIEGNKKVRYSRKSKSKLSSYNEERDSDNETEENLESEKDDNTNKKQATGFKLKFNSHQCYVCYKLFQTKPDLIEHCKGHFDVCSEVTLKKCPLCPYVTSKNIKGHMKLKHNVNINFSFMKIKDKKVNENGSRYYFDVDNEAIKKLEIIPSIKILNKKASMEIDKKNRELKDKSLLKRKLVRKGKEWIVETEKIDVSKHVVPNLKEKDNYLAKMKMLSIESRKNKLKMLYPCNNCDKICQNLSALTLHMRRHDPNAKPFKPKVWKHKKELQVEQPVLPVENIIDTSNRDAKPRPIVNKHKCDPKLKAFYENNIKGGDIEFWQFLKIYNKMDREQINDFKELEARSDFGIHFNPNDRITDNNTNENNNSEETTRNSNNPVNNSSNTEKSVARKTTKGIKKVKFIRKIQLSKEEYKRRCEIKNQLRQKFAESNS